VPETEIQPTSEPRDRGERSLIPANIIRTETVLSKLPIHNLAKKGSRSIRIVRQNDQGEIDLLWKVTPNPAYGEPRELAYKLDTIVINRRIEEQGRPLPEFLRIGSLREIAEQLRLGGNTNKIKQALSQNAHTVLTAEFTYTTTTGEQQQAEFQTTRYGLIFTGEKLPNGRKADAVYITLNPPYRHILNNAVFRPLNYDYLKELTPAAQRFYELISYKIFAALHNTRPEARIAYSELCTFSPLQRYFDYDHFKKQMYKIHRQHLKSGYLDAVRYDPTTDNTGKPDWNMFYTPGGKARIEYETFTGKRPRFKSSEAGDSPIDEDNGDQSAGSVIADSNPEPVDPLLPELIKRGIARDQAIKLLKNAAADQPILDQLEYGDYEKTKPNSAIRGAGFYVYLIKNNIPVPDDFETSRKQKLREEARLASDREVGERLRLELAYEVYKREEMDKHIKANYTPDQYQQLVARKKEELLNERRSLFANWREEVFESYADRQVRADLARWVPFTKFDTFCEQQKGSEVQRELTFPEDDGTSPPTTFAV